MYVPTCVRTYVCTCARALARAMHLRRDYALRQEIQARIRVYVPTYVRTYVCTCARAHARTMHLRRDYALWAGDTGARPRARTCVKVQRTPTCARYVRTCAARTYRVRRATLRRACTRTHLRDARVCALVHITHARRNRRVGSQRISAYKHARTQACKTYIYIYIYIYILRVCVCVCVAEGPG